MEEKSRENYVSVHFSQIHDVKNMEREYLNYFKFFMGNYYKEIPHDGKVLDMGCGLGETIFALKKLGYNDITGIDYSMECVDFCANNFSGEGIKVYQGNALEYFYNCSEKNDIIFFNDIIEHFVLEDVVKILQGMKLCLNNGGVIIIKTMNGGNSILGTTTLYSDLTHKIMFDEFSLKEVLIIAGFENIKIKKANLYCFFHNPLNYVAWGINGFISMILRLYFALNNKKNTMFTKNIIAVVRK